MACKHFIQILEESCRYYIDSPQDNNCVLCLIKRLGPMTQEQIGEYMNLTRMRILQIEKQAIKKLQKEKQLHLFFDN